MGSYNVAWLLAAANAARLWPLLHMHPAWEVLLVSNSNDNPGAPYAHCPRAFCKDYGWPECQQEDHVQR